MKKEPLQLTSSANNRGSRKMIRDTATHIWNKLSEWAIKAIDVKHNLDT